VNGGATLRMAVIMVHHPSSDDRFRGKLPGLGWVQDLCAIRGHSLADGSQCFRMVADTAGQAIKAELRVRLEEKDRDKR
jgi:hypothetical protein